MKELILIICTLTIAISRAQMPGFGWCPDKRAMPGFDIDKVFFILIFYNYSKVIMFSLIMFWTTLVVTNFAAVSSNV